MRSTYLLVCFLVSTSGYCQLSDKSLKKIGGYLNPNHFSQSYGFTLSVELEKAFVNSKLTHGFRLDYMRARPFATPNKFFTGYENLIVGYNLKVYPFLNSSNGNYKGYFIGLHPSFFVKVQDRYRYGPGIGLLTGYQAWIKRKFTICPELGIIYMKNVNNKIYSNSRDLYFYSLISVKVGFTF